VPFSDLIASTIDDTFRSLPQFLPELVLCGTILVMLTLRVFDWTRWIGSFHVALAGTLIALWYAIEGGILASPSAAVRQEIFTGLLVYDNLTSFFRVLLLSFAVLFCLLTRITRLTSPDDAADFYSLVLGATVGFCLMASANHLLMVFLAVEMASVPSYVLAGLLKTRRRSSEAALKYSVYGAGAAGVMLYGISLLCGITGSAHLPTIAAQLVHEPLQPAALTVLALGGLMIMVGLAFKLSAVPFHFWCPDVFEGATAEVNAFLSVASKAAALALLVRVCVGVGFTPADANQSTAGRSAASATRTARLVSFATVDPAEQSATHAATDAPEQGSRAAPLSGQTIRNFMVMLLSFLAAITCTFGNLAAYGQTNIKRLLAYSTIAHAGYMIMPVPAALVLAGTDPGLAREAIGALVFYTSVYLFMNLGAFAIVAFLRQASGSEQIDDYAGLVRSNPVAVICFAILLVSLIGMPPLAGFVAKFFVFASLVDAGGPVMMALLVIAGLNTVISLVYYLRVVKVMTMDPEPARTSPFHLGFLPAVYLVAITVPVLILGVYFNGLYRLAEQATAHLFI
jgi:NADH-quinone oxidoreductase subunit N